MKLIVVADTGISVYRFNQSDAEIIVSRCIAAGKQWSKSLLGFFINIRNDANYAAITIKGGDGVIESMEYRDIDTGKSEFTAHPDFLAQLATMQSDQLVNLVDFESMLNEILTASVKARRWEVYPEISQYYPSTH